MSSRPSHSDIASLKRLLARHGAPADGADDAHWLKWLEAPLPDPAAINARRRHDRHALRTLFAPSLIGDARPDALKRLPGLAREMTHVYLFIFHRRFEAKKPISPDEAAALALAVHVMDRSKPSGSAVLTDLRRWLRETMGNEGFDSLTRLEPLSAAHSRNVAALHGAVHGRKDRSWPPRYDAPVRQSLAGLIGADSPAETGRRLSELFDSFFDSSISLFRQGAAGPLFIGAMIPLALGLTCERLKLPSDPPPEQADRPRLPEPSTTRLEAVRLADRLRTPPDLPASLDPLPPDGFLWSLETELVREAGFTPRAEPAGPLILSIRHDVDRPLDGGSLDRILAWERSTGVRSSWYFKAETWREDLADRILHAGSEVGYHAAHIETGDHGFASRVLAHLQRSGRTAVGCTFHGGPGTTFWRGRASLDAASTLGFSYAEMLTEWFAHPYAVEAGGRTLMVTPPSVKFDAQPEWVEDHMRLIASRGGHAIIENHPDLFSDAFAAFIRSWMDRRAIVQTAGEHVEGCRKSILDFRF